MTKKILRRSLSLAPHSVAIAQALFVTFLWSTSWVLIKIGLQDIPALTFAGLRYTLAIFCLLPLAIRPAYLAELHRLSRADWGRLVLLGVLCYAITQGAQFLALAYLPAVTTTLLLSFTTIVVALLSIFLLGEQPRPLQWIGIILNLAGVLLYFSPTALPASQVVGVAIALVGVLTNALSAILGRTVNRTQGLSPLLVTVVSMGIGALLLLITGVAIQGMPRLSPLSWAIVLWLAIVNTAFAFTLWNHTLRTLSAVESTIINGSMLVQITILAWLFLGEQLTWREGIGIIMAGAGVLIVQWRPANKR